MFKCSITYCFPLMLTLANAAVSNESVNHEPTRAQIVSHSRTSIAAGVTAVVSKTFVYPGDRIKKGATMIALDCGRYEAAYAIAQARVEVAQARHTSAEQLLQYKSVGPLEVKIAEADLKKALGEEKTARIDVESCSTHAPFDAVVVERFVQPHQFVNRGDPLLEIYSPTLLEVQLVVPSAWLNWLTLGHTFTMQVEELNRKVNGKITRFGGVIDPVSQTIELFGSLNTNSNDEKTETRSILPGMSGSIFFTNETNTK